MSPDYLTAHDLCVRYQINPRTIWNWIAHRDFPPGVKLGRLRRWRTDDVTAWEVKQSKAA